MRRITLLPILFIFLILACLISPNGSLVLGQGGGITLKSVAVRDQYPDGILFQVAVETMAPAQIKEIRLEVKVTGSNRGDNAYLEFEPAKAVEGRYLLLTSGAQYRPPGTLLEYRLSISDSERRILETPKETYLHLDSRFEWSHMAEGLVEVYYYGPTETEAELIIKGAAEAIDKVGRLLGIQLTEPVRIIAYNDAYDLIPARPFEPRASEIEYLFEGVTFPEYGILLMALGFDRPDGVASHEITHFLVGKLTKNAYTNIPAWLSEGFAEYGNINQDSVFESLSLLSQAIAQGYILVLRNLQTPPVILRDRLLMDGHGYAVVKFMIDTYGESKFRELLGEFSQGRQIDEALQRVYGFDQDGLDNAWRTSLGLPLLEGVEPILARPVPAAESRWWGSSRSIVILAITAVVIVGLALGVVLRRRAHS